MATLGWREWVALPEPGIPALKVKVDTGTRTCALHAFTLETFHVKHRRRVRFGFEHRSQRSDRPQFRSFAGGRGSRQDAL